MAFWREVKEEDDDARQQHQHQDHGRQEDGSAQRPARQPEQNAGHTSRIAVTLHSRAGEPHIQRAVH